MQKKVRNKYREDDTHRIKFYQKPSKYHNLGGFVIFIISAESIMNQGLSIQERNYNKWEFSYRSFVRSFTLPDAADENGIQATYVDGVLCIDIAKREEAKMQSRQIEIKYCIFSLYQCHELPSGGSFIRYYCSMDSYVVVMSLLFF